MLTDEAGKSKGAAFLDFSSAQEAQDACGYDGREIPGSRRRLRINPANSKLENSGVRITSNEITNNILNKDNERSTVDDLNRMTTKTKYLFPREKKIKEKKSIM